eukprot:scaffold18897_cov53-Phaeocystis_antarctica.AAC.2
MFRPGSRFQVPGGVRNTAWDRGGGMRHRGAKCACRVDPATSGGAAESTSSCMRATLRRGASMSNAYRSLRTWLSIFFYPHSYLFDGAAAAVTSSRRLPVWGGQQPPHRSFFCLEQPATRTSCTLNATRGSAQTRARLDTNPHKARHHPTRPLGCGTRPDPEPTSPTRSHSRLPACPCWLDLRRRFAQTVRP